MSLVNLAHVCSHLQNASKARLGLTSIPVSKLHANLMLGLQREGFLASVTLGGTTPPKPYGLQTTLDPEEHERLALKLADMPWAAYPTPSPSHTDTHTSTSSAPSPGPSSSPNTSPNKSNSKPQTRTKSPPPLLGAERVLETHVPANPARRRLWLGLKYWNSEPVLRHMQLISKPTRRIWLTGEELAKITRSRRSGYVEGLTHPGECMFLTTDRGILEARECVERRLGGMALCRVW